MLFELPNEFDGNLADVFQLMADYTRTKTDGKFIEVVDKHEGDASYSVLLNYVNSLLKERNSRVDISYGLINIDEKNEKYDVMARVGVCDNVKENNYEQVKI